MSLYFGSLNMNALKARLCFQGVIFRALFLGSLHNIEAIFIGPQLPQADQIAQHKTVLQLASAMLPAKQLGTFSRPADKESIQGQSGGKQLLGINCQEKSAFRKYYVLFLKMPPHQQETQTVDSKEARYCRLNKQPINTHFPGKYESKTEESWCRLICHLPLREVSLG